MGSFRSDEAKGRWNRGRCGSAFEQPGNEEDRQVGSQSRHEHGHPAKDGTQEHDHLAAVAIREYAEDDRPGQLRGVETTRQERVCGRTGPAAVGHLVDEVEQQAAGDRRADSQHERTQQH